MVYYSASRAIKPINNKDKDKTMKKIIEIAKLRRKLAERLASTKQEMNRKGIKQDELMFLKGYERCLDNILFWLPPDPTK